jgi:malate dehydrogenase (oxaloacetate-decarboxylating)
MGDPRSNRGVAFTERQRSSLGLIGRLPSGVLSPEAQGERAYRQLSAQPDDLAKNVYLEQLHDRNEVLYFRLLTEHLTELLPIVYDPTVGEAIERYSHEYRRPRGLFLSIDRPEDIEASFAGLGLGPGDVDLIVCSDAEAILGIGDWGVGGIQISVGKLAVYTAAAGIDPRRVIAVSLDVGTDNQNLLADPLYLGNRHARRRGTEYDEFIAAYIRTEYSEQVRIFNDDIQGTAAIVLAGVLAGIRATGIPMWDQEVVVFGAGTAGVGIADQLRDAMVRDGAKLEDAIRQVWLVDKQGLLTADMDDLRDFQQPYARQPHEVAGWASAPSITTLLDTVRHVHPTILVGTSTAHGAFTQPVVEEMCAGTERPIIFPISNPTSKIEAMPADVINWSRGKALVATGIPVEPVDYDGVRYEIGQANNALLYPGVGLGVVVSRAARVTDGMLLAAAEAVAGQVDASVPGTGLVPPVGNLRASSAIVAAAVVRAAVAEGVADRQPDNVIQAVQDAVWQPIYPDLEAS